MKLARATVIFAVLLLAAIANAQYAPPGVPGAMYPGQVIPVPNSSQNYFSIPPMYMPAPPSSNFQGFSPGYNQFQNFQSAPYSEFGPPPFSPYSNSFNSFSNPYSNSFSSPYSDPFSFNPYQNPYNQSDSFSDSYRSREDDEDRLEKEQEREEAREDRREKREQEREDQRRKDREEREADRRGDSDRSKDKDVNNWPPIPKSSDKAKQYPVFNENSGGKPVQSTGAKAADSVKPAKPSTQPQARPQTQNQTTPQTQATTTANTSQQAPPVKKQQWWETNPEYQNYLKQQKAFEQGQRQASTNWPPKPQPVVAEAPHKKQIDSTTGKLAASAQTDCESCGPRQGPLAQQIDQMKELADPREVFILTRPPTNKVSDGIRKVMNTIYQSCDAYNTLLRPDYCQDGFVGAPDRFCAKQVDRKQGDLTAYHNPQEFFSYARASQPGSNVLIPTTPEGPQCRDMYKTPPVFKVGGRATLSADHKTLNLFNNGKNGTKFVTMDCSGFVSATYQAAGLNFVANSPGAQVTTSTLRAGTPSCLNTVSFSPKRSIESGDIAVFAGESEHSMIFDRVGPDPFGLETIPKMPQASEPHKFCRDNLKVSEFDFVIAQSGLYGGRVAASEARAVDYIVNFGNGMLDGINAQIMQLAEDACVAKITGSAVTANHHDGAKLLRHKGSSAPGCVRPAPPELVGGSCVKGCT